MHAVVKDRLEEYLSGTVEPAGQRDIERHLGACEECRDEVAAMQDMALLFNSLRAEEELVPAPGFYARVMQEAGGRQPALSLSGVFSFNLVFARRLVFACLITLAVLGSYLVVSEGESSLGPSPEAVMAQQNHPSFHSPDRGQDNMLVTLAAYDEP